MGLQSGVNLDPNAPRDELAQQQWAEEDCRNIGYLLDKEFSMRRELLTQPCEDDDALNDWQAGSGFETRWDLGVK